MVEIHLGLGLSRVGESESEVGLIDLIKLN